ncbi:hypothetical protein L3V83_11320 [Thiotrichales bacterium 19X7-9]|nr:hypothetical protein [Thiotrichales bacterium 19X7-9]
MTDVQIQLFLILILLSIGYWLVPFKFRSIFIITITSIFLYYLSAITCVILFIETLLSYYAAREYAKRHNSQFIFIPVAMLVIFFIIYQYYYQKYNLSLPLIIGFAYFTCRQIHYLIETYKNSITNIHFLNYLSYQFFLPAIFSGPIHRYQNFSKQIQRAYITKEDISLSIERIIYGYFKVVVIANYFISFKIMPLITNENIISLYAVSFLTWLFIYISFSGLTDIALGFSKLMGIKLEENFNHPYKANSLIEFWERWHMTLTRWAKDYVFMPVFMTFRIKIFAVIFALIAIGFWHEVSLHYILWGLYQAVGVILCKTYTNTGDILNLKKLPHFYELTIKKTATFLWLLSFMPLYHLLGVYL